MLFKVALALVLGSLGLFVVRRLADTENAARLEQTVESQLQAQRDHMFRR
jgi:hypothetical protein